ncbi:protein-L-isoaspartate O-methyltransferase [Candidatus Dojkabacteria bacterium]|uniref:Protein-L-isoaspartate O-methyltransferase n=1 Tax=Candidatus Dojkabacteria bacterium TaxID=2099670 RepID=A0A847VDE5_9BACT|nr:protein-L-isoaspartate O-methyltransferase [Candidatus Dojkabacteria bacterium]
MDNNYIQTQKEQLLKEIEIDIKDKKVLKALKEVPRECFFDEEHKEFSYLNAPFSIGYGQTISQPYIVALMTELLQLKRSDKVLDIGTGSGYQAAILSKLCKEVVSIEIVEELYLSAKARLKRLGYDNVKCVLGNGVEGYEKGTPYDKILCAAAYPEIPPSWIKQLKRGGIIVFPLETSVSQDLVTVTKNMSGEIKILSHEKVVFVPLINK